MVHPAIYSRVNLFKSLKYHAHTGFTGLKYVHPAAKMCTQGAGCTLNFEHWVYILFSECTFRNVRARRRTLAIAIEAWDLDWRASEHMDVWNLIVSLGFNVLI